MKDETKNDIIIVAVCMFLAFVFAGIGYWGANDAWEKDAVRRGHGTYVENGYDYVFKWNEDVEDKDVEWSR